MVFDLDEYAIEHIDKIMGILLAIAVSYNLFAAFNSKTKQLNNI